MLNKGNEQGSTFYDPYTVWLNLSPSGPGVFMYVEWRAYFRF